MSEKQDNKTAEKRECFEQWMKGDHVLVHVDTRSEDVQVPESHLGDASLTLKLSYFFQGETTHDELGIISYLKFDGQYVKCSLPWNSLWGMTSSSGETQVWPEDVPREIYLKMARSKLVEAGKKLLGKSSSKDSTTKKAADPKSSPSLVDVKMPPTEKEKKSDQDKNSKAKDVSHLKRIK